ncbi:hypothetical protein P5V15_004623 [Pogonomyrmex californicus]
MTELAKEAFTSRNYHLAVELYERCLKQQGPSYDVLLGYGDSLVKCGRVRESIEIYSRCLTATSVPAERLKHLATALLEDMVGIGMSSRRKIETSFACPLCEGTLCQPVTTSCGHTYCRNCVDPTKNCRVCGTKIAIVSETNVLVQGLVERWWPREVEASRARHEGDILVRKGHLGQALERYNLAVHLGKEITLSLLGHYRRGIALSALGRHEEALYALCISVAIDKNPQAVRHELTKILHKVLLPRIHRQNVLASRMPYSLSKSASRTRNRHQLINPKRNRCTALNRSDCEDNSSDEEEFTQTVNRRVRSTIIPQVNTKLQISLNRLYQDAEKLKRIESRPAEILLPTLSSGTAGELDCILCCRLLWKPVTTPCGHTYCWMCLDRCLDYSSACPLCVTSLADYLASSQKTVTDFVERALKTVAPAEYTSRAVSHQLELVQGLGLLNNEQIAVFICTTAFPCVACPLFVYEPRYRLMIRRCMESGVRQFGIAACLNKEATGTKRYAEYGTILDIRDRVLLKDGCSILSTIGGRRFRVLSGGEKDGYDTAQVEFLRDTVVQEDQLLNLLELHDKVRAKGRRWWDTVSTSQKSEIQRVFGRMPDTEEDWSRLPDGPSWAWWLLAILPLGPQLQVGILGTTSLEKRLRAIEKTLDHMEQRQLTIAAAPSEQTTTSSSICRDGRAITETAMSVVQQS